MSARKSVVSKVQKPYCKVCHDAGKSESEYTNHFVRSNPGPNGVVVCPTLLSQECRYCLKNGHTVKFCPVLKEKEKAPVTNKKIVTEKVAERKPVNKYAVLDLSSDSESDEKPKQKVSKMIVTKTPKQEPKEDFPEMKAAAGGGAISKTPRAPMLTGYAAMVTKIAPKVEAKVEAKVAPETPPAKIEAISRPPPVFKSYKGRSWADDWSDSDDEELDNVQMELEY